MAHAPELREMKAAILKALYCIAFGNRCYWDIVVAFIFCMFVVDIFW